MLQTENALRYYQFAEIYHPLTGQMYGGRQESGNGIVEWNSEPYQTWSATAYLRNVYMDLVGMKFTEKGITFAPVGSSLTNAVKLTSFKYRNAVFDITIKGKGASQKSFRINGEDAEPFVPCDSEGRINIEIVLE